ncbi:VOC family protein [Micromonospora sp. NPDC000089]|uniref:VOC family protein n=1 Tax=unclassified Micromonospora TaxID=2617518 RepID=UPI00369BEB0A
MLPRLLTVTFDAYDPGGLARFWGDLLGRDVRTDGDAALLPGGPTQVGLRFAPSPGGAHPSPAERVRHRHIHLHLTSDSPDGQQQAVATARQLGATPLDVGQRPEEGHVVLADPEGNAFCVIEPGNSFLAGCGPLGELACDGTRAVGVFWSAALGWPLVWDQDGETAIQSPAGGTKVAWGGPPLNPKAGRNRQRFDLAPADGDQRAEVERLIGLGATRVEVAPDGAVVLADPDGNEFRVPSA